MPKFKILGTLFAVCGLVGTLSLFQINQLSKYGEAYYGIAPWMSGLFFAILTGYILFGGLRSISRACTTIVPIMSVGYFLVVVIIMLMNVGKIPQIMGLIINEALNPQSAFGGIVGYGFIHILTIGMKRATFSNEAGIGTAPMAHSNSKTSEPISEGYVAMLGPFIDTIIVCSLTAFAILICFPDGTPQGLSGIELSTAAFTQHLGENGKHFLAVTIVMFAFSTMLGMANYNQKCWDYLFKGRWGLSDKTFLIFYSSTILIGALIPMMNVVNLMDIAFALMTIPNIMATIYLAGKVQAELKKYNQKKLSR